MSRIGAWYLELVHGVLRLPWKFQSTFRARFHAASLLARLDSLPLNRLLHRISYPFSVFLKLDTSVTLTILT